jgi:hypothetical protein
MDRQRFFDPCQIQIALMVRRQICFSLRSKTVTQETSMKYHYEDNQL